LNALNQNDFFFVSSAIAPALLYLLHNPQGCGECREMTGSFPVLAVVRVFVVIFIKNETFTVSKCQNLLDD
jgi:hypothetical protein